MNNESKSFETESQVNEIKEQLQSRKIEIHSNQCKEFSITRNKTIIEYIIIFSNKGVNDKEVLKCINYVDCGAMKSRYDKIKKNLRIETVINYSFNIINDNIKFQQNR